MTASYIPTITFQSGVSPIQSTFSGILSFVVPQDLSSRPTSGSNRILYELGYTYRGITNTPTQNKKFIQAGQTIILDLPDGTQLENFTFILKDKHCSTQPENRYYIVFTRVS